MLKFVTRRPAPPSPELETVQEERRAPRRRRWWRASSSAIPQHASLHQPPPLPPSHGRGGALLLPGTVRPFLLEPSLNFSGCGPPTRPSRHDAKDLARPRRCFAPRSTARRGTSTSTHRKLVRCYGVSAQSSRTVTLPCGIAERGSLISYV